MPHIQNSIGEIIDELNELISELETIEEMAFQLRKRIKLQTAKLVQNTTH